MSIRGTCTQLCPTSEAKLRIKENILHFYELKDGQKKVPGTLVKSFSRSAAGLKVPRAQELRTEKCLHETINYLFINILLDTRRPYGYVYEFIFDRMRAIRQEIVMQEFNEAASVALLEPIVMFLAYSRYNLCEATIQEFDIKICDTHLQECLKIVLACYDKMKVSACSAQQMERRIYMESLYQVFNLGEIASVTRVLTLPVQLREAPLLKRCFCISKNYFLGNFYSVLQQLPLLPHIICAMTCLKLPVIRKKLLLTLTHAYNNSRLYVELSFVCRVCAYMEDIRKVSEDCRLYGIQIVAKEHKIKFVKSECHFEHLAKCRKEQFVEDKFKNIYLPDLLLLNKFL